MADFVERFGACFAGVCTRGVTDGDDFVASPSEEAILHAIRRRYQADATLAILFIGRTTWTRRFVDWELAAALAPRPGPPLPVLTFDLGDDSPLPPRLRCGVTCTRRGLPLPTTVDRLEEAIRSVVEPPDSSRASRCCASRLLRQDL